MSTISPDDEDQWVVVTTPEISQDEPPIPGNEADILSESAPCRLCNNLQKKDKSAPRLAIELTAEQCMRIKKTKSCCICTTIAEGIQRFEKDASWSLRDDVSRVYLYARSSRGDSLTAEVYFRTDLPKLVLEYYRPHQVPPEDAIRTRTPVTGFPVLTNGLRWVRSTLENCQAQHRLCHAAKQVLLPRRTVHVERLSSGQIHIKICEHENEIGRYVALSHCWGSQQGCISTFDKLEAYKREVPWDILPATFQDAITFTLELGVHHIWIDSLCIMQRNSHDWDVESSRMAEIYHNAYMILAATAASNGGEGCFSVRRTPAHDFQLDVAGMNGPVMVREKIRHWSQQSSKVDIKSFPLLTRGWVLQERYLSPRTLHFCAHELVWECSEDLTCECGGIAADSDRLERLRAAGDVEDAVDVQAAQACERGRIDSSSSGSEASEHDLISSKKRYSHSPNPDEPSKKSQNVLPPSYEEAEAIYVESQRQTDDPVSEKWHSIVEQYTALKLSKETDRLPALSGLAKLGSSSLDTYLCGLWLQTIATDLLWRVPILNPKSGRHTVYTGPSWSWASVNGSVSYWTDLEEDVEAEQLEIELLRRNLQEAEGWHDRQLATHALMQRLGERDQWRKQLPNLKADCQVTLAGENPFGEVKSAPLTVRGLVRSATLLYVRHWESSGSTKERKHDPLKYQLATQLYEGNQSQFEMELSFFADYNLSEEGEGKLEDRSPLTLFCVQRYVCLVLVGGPRVYRRIGIVRQPAGYQSVYRLNWMANAPKAVITIV